MKYNTIDLIQTVINKIGGRCGYILFDGKNGEWKG